MKHLRKYIMLCFAIAYAAVCIAHEEPSKTLYEKKEKALKQKQIFKSKIKTATVWKSVADNGIETNNKAKAFVMGYDSQGHFIYIEAYKNDSLIEKDEYAYSSSNDMISETDYLPNGKITEKNYFSFDRDGRLISGISKNENDSISGSFKIHQSADKKAIEFVKYHSDSIEYKIVYEYPDCFDKSDFSQASKYDSQAKLMMKVEKTYNSKGLQTKKIIFDSDEKILYSFLYEYDKAGNNTKITKKLVDDSIEWVDIYIYDSKNICTDLKSYDKDNILKTHLVYDYEYYQ